MTRKPIGSPPPAARSKLTMHLYVPKSDALTGKRDPRRYNVCPGAAELNRPPGPVRPRPSGPDPLFTARRSESRERLRYPGTERKGRHGELQASHPPLQRAYRRRDPALPHICAQSSRSPDACLQPESECAVTLWSLPTWEPQGPARTGREAEKATTKASATGASLSSPATMAGPREMARFRDRAAWTFPCSVRSETIKTTDTFWQDAHWLTAVQKPWLRARESKDWRRARVR